ncbi:isochorismatase family protein [Roseomonas sp. NAR14]|uniref:Isochorismatase family protein n=1 Tax=Roseomonas acroporae TaxID=2937791 RepID=A0A9X2BZ79_9PROT|nr:isochorismatase family protein [Roseomonas acroporae]MCK8787754.1 isochorismatase family protein [Roseomonas acroporae]
MNAHDTLVLFADLQPEIVARSRTTAPDALAASAGILAEVGAILGLPLLFSVVPEGSKPPVLIPQLAGYARADRVFPRMTATPWLDPAIVAAIEETGRRTIVVAGFATEVVTLHAARGAVAAGYRAIVPVDANGGMSAATEAAALRRIEQAGGETSAVVSVATELAPDFAAAPGAAVFAALQKLRLA